MSAATDPTDEELMARLGEGEESALEVLLARHGDRVAAFVRGLVGSTGPIDDLVQETFVRVFRARANYRPTARFTTWLLTVARNVARDHVRGKRRKPLPQAPAAFPGYASGATSLLGRIPASVGTPSALVSSGELSGFVQEALLRLPLEQREAILLVEFEGLTLREAGEAVGSNLKTVASRLARGKERLAELLRPLLRTDVSPPDGRRQGL